MPTVDGLQFPGLMMIHVVWDGPRPITEAFNYNGDSDFGLYALYGTHFVSGPDTLLYVGQSNMNPFGGRLEAHYEKWARSEPSDVNVYFGRIGDWGSLTDQEWGALIDRAEALTIYYTSPPYNSERPRELKVEEPILVLNHKRRHRIPMCITNISALINLEDGAFKLLGPAGHHPRPPPEAKEHEDSEGNVLR